MAAAARADEASAARVHAGTVRARPRNMVRQNAVGASTQLTEHTMGACSSCRARRHTCSVRQGLVRKSGRPGFARHSRTLGFTSVGFHVPEGLALACCWLRPSTHARGHAAPDRPSSLWPQDSPAARPPANAPSTSCAITGGACMLIFLTVPCLALDHWLQLPCASHLASRGCAFETAGCACELQPTC